MPEHFKYIAASYLLLINDGNILLQRRYNTGFMDGWYGLPSGHLDGGETAREGGSREFKEELGIRIDPEDLSMVHVMHRKARNDERIDFFMTTKRYEGTIENREPHKCDDLRWCPPDALPENTIDYIVTAIKAFRDGEFYSEFGWSRHTG
ncbi:NUDIX domain-containing protein [Candidatus Kaiserbacteria bacterium]|nr:NUDIX domain-containing protein [Candidatus Kaiserbacteria bacterium]